MRDGLTDRQALALMGAVVVIISVNELPENSTARFIGLAVGAVLVVLIFAFVR